jgi:hypothetical protein
MTEKIEYETPRAQVRGVFLCENVADTAAVSALTGGITQEGWGADDILGDVDSEGGDLWLGY